MNVNDGSEVKDLPSNSKNLVKSNDYKFHANLDSSFSDQTKVVSKDLEIRDRVKVDSFQHVNTLKDSNKDLDSKSPITTADKKLQPYGTSLEKSGNS